jgi:hypothetical protein
MITVLDLSIPRKHLYKGLNNLLFELKMKNIDIRTHGNIIILTLLFLCEQNNKVMAQQLETSQYTVLKKQMKELIEIYGIPTIYTFGELIKIKSHMFNYCKIKLNLKN